MTTATWVHTAKRIIRRFGGQRPACNEPAPAYEESSGSLDQRDKDRILKSLFAGRDVRHVFDVGANVGRLTESYLLHFPGAQVHAFEPNPELAAHLNSKFDGNDRVNVVDRVVCDRSGMVIFHLNALDATSSILPRNQDGRRYYSSKDGLLARADLAAVTLDEYCRASGITHVDLLKFDIQGGEGAALRGACRLLEGQHIDAIYSECYFVPHYEGALLLHELWTELERYGYSLYDLFLDRHGRNGQLRFGDALFISPAFRAAVVDRYPDEP
jgi:FkbM family methyltransferase